MDRNNTGRFDAYKLYSFLREQEFLATDEDLAAVIRRMDCDSDEQVSYQEFKDFLPPEYVIHDKLLSDNARFDHKKPTQKSCLCIDCKQRACTCGTSDQNSTGAFPTHELDILVRTLIELVQVERQHDKAKQTLMQKLDFNLTDAFKIF